jgi:hypothetical protein
MRTGRRRRHIALFSAAADEGAVQMYGHPPHTGIGALVLTLVASAKGGIGYLARVVSHAHH